MNVTTQIAKAMNVSPNQIKSVREMAWVYCVVVHGQRATFVSKKVVKMDWQDKEYVKIKEYVHPAGVEYQGYLQWATAVEAAKKGEIPAITHYDVVSCGRDGIWSIVGSSYDRDEAIEIAAAIKPLNINEIPAGYAVTSTGDVVAQDDWDEIEGAM